MAEKEAPPILLADCRARTAEPSSSPIFFGFLALILVALARSGPALAAARNADAVSLGALAAEAGFNTVFLGAITGIIH
jgi:hypothetical protein